MRSDHILCTHCSPLKGQRKHNMVAEPCSWFTSVIMASAEDMRALLEPIGGMERARIEQQARADQASTALQALQQQQQQSATTAQQAQRRASAAQAAGAGASTVVDTRLLSKPMAFDGRETSWWSFKFQFVACCRAIDSRLTDLLVLGETRDVAAMRNINMDPDTRALSAQLYYMLIIGVSGWCAKAVGARRRH